MMSEPSQQKIRKNGIRQKTAASTLISNKDRHLTDYRNRGHIESLFGDAKGYLSALPMAEWNKETRKEKICLYTVTGRF